MSVHLNHDVIELLKDNFDTINEVETYLQLILDEIKDNHLFTDDDYESTENDSTESSGNDSDLEPEPELEIIKDKDNFFSLK
jgi:hypothetical protein